MSLEEHIRHAYLIKGWHCSVSPPKPVREALDALIAGLSAYRAPRHEPEVELSLDGKTTPSPFDMSVFELGGGKRFSKGLYERHKEDMPRMAFADVNEICMGAPLARYMPIATKQVAQLAARIVSASKKAPVHEEPESDDGAAPETTKKGTYTNWTHKQKCILVRAKAAGDKWKDISEKVGIPVNKCSATYTRLMKKGLLDYYLQGDPDEDVPTAHRGRKSKPEAPSAQWVQESLEDLGDDPPVKAFDAARISEEHSEYAGQREDGRIEDSDWPDIRQMLSQGKDQQYVAAMYGVTFGQMKEFIERQQTGHAEDTKLVLMRAMRKNGASDKAISMKYNCSEATVKYMLREPKKKPAFRMKTVSPEPDNGPGELDF